MDNTNTIVYVQVRQNRPDGFLDPPPFQWDVEKERKLWGWLSREDGASAGPQAWLSLSKDIEAPEYFLRRRSYRLVARHLELLRQQIVDHGLEDHQGLSNVHPSTSNEEPQSTNLSGSGGEDTGSSNPSVSKSALEEALMDRLKL